MMPFMASLDADTLDTVSATVPIVVLNQSQHIAYVNHKAFELAGITDSTPDPSGWLDAGTHRRAEGAVWISARHHEQERSPQYHG